MQRHRDARRALRAPGTSHMALTSLALNHARGATMPTILGIRPRLAHGAAEGRRRAVTVVRRSEANARRERVGEAVRTRRLTQKGDGSVRAERRREEEANSS